MSSATTKQRIASTQEVFDHHLQAFSAGIDALVSDYTEDSAIVLADRTVQGLAGIRQFFADFLAGARPAFWESFSIRRATVEGDVAYLLWEAKPFVAMATDTLLVRNGKILLQTYTVLA
jgi:ketosteroid isomerase-like protein